MPVDSTDAIAQFRAELAAIPFPDNDYEIRVRAYEAQGMSRSDAHGRV